MINKYVISIDCFVIGVYWGIAGSLVSTPLQKHMVSSIEKYALLTRKPMRSYYFLADLTVLLPLICKLMGVGIGISIAAFYMSS